MKSVAKMLQSTKNINWSYQFKGIGIRKILTVRQELVSQIGNENFREGFLVKKIKN